MNGGALNISGSGGIDSPFDRQTATVSTFAAGDLLAFTITVNTEGHLVLVTGSGSPVLDSGALTSSSTATYRVTGAGDTSLSVVAASGNGSDNTSVAITATCTAATLGLTSAPSPTTQVGQGYAQTNTGSGGTQPFTYSVSAGALPAGTSLNTSTGLVSGTPTTGGAFSYTIKVSDSGSPVTETATQTLSGTIATANPTISVTSSANPSSFGQSVAFTATVTTGGGTATGIVTFKDGATLLGTGTLSGNSATFTAASLAPGSHSITASYGGDTNYAPAVSSALVQVVNPALTTTTVTSSANPSVFGQSVTLTAAVAAGGKTVTGTVTFKDGAAVLGTAPLSGNAATLTTTALAPGGHSITATYSGDTNFASSVSAAFIQAVNQAVTTTTVASSANPSVFGQSVVFTASVAAGGATATGTVTFKDGATVLGTATLSGNVATLTTTSLAAGGHSITASYGGDASFASSTSSALAQAVNQAATTTNLASSQNPSQVGQAVTFTATVSGSGGTPAGSVTFKDGAAILASATLSGGIAIFTTSSLTLGSHAITASYGGAGNFATSVSTPVIQAVNTPADSLKLRALQVLVTPMVAQTSGQAISGAVDSAISEGFGGGGGLITPSGSGVRFNFAADAEETSPGAGTVRASDPFSSATGVFASQRSSSRVDDGFAAMAYAGPSKALPRPAAPKERDWLAWAEVRGSELDRWGSSTAVPGATALYGSQINLLAGLTRKLTPNFLVGVLGGYETFDYRSDALEGRLKGDGWTVGSYLGWKITQAIRFDAAVAYSGIGYDGTAGSAAGSFGGTRWLVTSGLTGTYSSYGIQIEPSARIYALWEHENAYTDTLGTLQDAHNFSTGRASTGVKLSYPVAWSDSVAFAPYAGLYGDYYFTHDSAGAAVATAAIPSALVLDGWSARATGGVAARFSNGGQIAVGAERGGIGGNVGVWTYRANASVPFAAQ